MSFDISGLGTQFKNQLNGGEFIIEALEGTAVGLMNRFEGIVGTQQLNTVEFDPSWQTNGRTDVTAGGVSVFDANGSDVNFGARDITIGHTYAQSWMNPKALDNTYIGYEKGGDDDTGFLSAAVESARNQVRSKISSDFYVGIGATPTNGFLDITGTTSVDTGTADYTAANMLGKLDMLIEALAGTSAYSRNDNILLMNAADYILYRQALRAAGLNDVLQESVSETGVLSSPYITAPHITVVGDPAAPASMQPHITQTELTFFGTNTSQDAAELWYSQDRRAIGLYAEVYGGVQHVQPALILVNNNA